MLIRFSLIRAATSLFVPALLLAACDSAPGPVSLNERPPELSAFSFSPRNVVLEQLPPEQGDLVKVSLSVQVQARDVDGDLQQVSFVVQAPFIGAEAVATGDLAPTGGGQYAATTTIELNKSEVGIYTVLVFGVDEAGHMSNQVRGSLIFEARGAPPVIEDVSLPERIQRPASGEPAVLIPIVAAVSDPDGLRNIARVEMQIVPVGSGAPFLLCDDGGQGACNQGFSSSGDEEAGDGRFTITLQLESTNAPGETTFQFKAFDRSGLESEPVTRTITVE